MNNANSFSTIKSASASIAFFHKINIFANHSTMALEVCMVRTAAARKFGLSAIRVKDPFLWFQLVDCAVLYNNQTKALVTLLRLWLSFYSLLCVVIVMLLDSSGRIFNLNRILALSKLPLG
jgi:hypothetical protein